jgi:Methyltransferase domain
MSYEAMYQYYREQAVLPTHGRFQSGSDLDAHERHRREVFTQKLFLPPRIFRDARLIEFGPDAGENSLVFARWGASCTLVEPNPKAHPVIESYFRAFDLTRQLAGLEGCDVKAYATRPGPAAKFDFIDAEGFIYTVKPDSLWIDLFSRIANDGAFVILFYCDPFGNFFELFTKVIHAKVRQVLGTSPLETAQKLFLTKWNSIPHKRSLESWVMDVMENPFVRFRYFLEPQALCTQMLEAGFQLYSSWPPYKNGLKIDWFKKTPSAAEQLRTQNEFIASSRLGHLFGRQHFMPDPDPALEKRLADLLTLTDSLIDRFDTGVAARCAEHLEVIARVLGSDSVFADPQDTATTLRAIDSTQRILQFLSADAIDALIAFCNTDPGFIETWGMPSHFAVFQKVGSFEGAPPKEPPPQ